MPDPPHLEQMRVVEDARGRISSVHFRYANDPLNPNPPSHCLFHYTDSKGLIGIVEDNKLWATSAYFLNDTSEITYGYGLLAEALRGWIAVNPRPQGALSLQLALDLERSFGGDLLNRSIISPIYLTCFCKQDNLLSQWRAYGQSGGYSVGFNLPEHGARGGVKPEPSIYTARLVKVEYDRDSQLARCRAIVDEVLQVFDTPALA